MLTLPFAPHCERADCATEDAERAVGAAPEATSSPFGALAVLKGSPADKRKR